MENLTILNDEKFRRMMLSAPRAMTTDLRKWMYRERRRFVGNKTQHGKFRRSLMRKDRRQRDGKWPESTARAFKGFMKGRERLDGMSMHMGVGFNASKPFTQGLAQMEQPRTISKSRGMFIVPVWSNLTSEGIHKGQHAAFRRKLEAKELDIVFKNGRAFYFDRATNKLLWVGLRQVSIPKQHNFTKMFRSDSPAIRRRAENQVKRTLRAIERGYRADG